jgi:putative MFS transporter
METTPKSRSIVEETQFTPFLKRLTVFCCGGPFLDGYILVIIGAALVQLTPLLQMNAYMAGLSGAISLAGLFLGGAVFGYVTDLIGRKLMFTLDLITIVVCSILCMFISNIGHLLILRFVIGMAVGADYPIATSLLAEFAPKKHRGMLLGILQVFWFVGAVAANFVGYFLIDMNNGWKFMLGSAAIPAIILVLGRWGTPESPRWLMSKNRVDEARAVMKSVYGPDSDVDELEQEVVSTKFSKIFEKGYFSRLIFCGGFWLCSVLPLFAIYTFGPTILEQFNLAHGKAAMLGDSLLSAVFMIGCIISLWLINRMGRRPLIIWTFAIMAVGMLILGIMPNAGPAVIILGFCIYALASGGPADLEWIYPNELFPTEVRASAVGVATAISRIGAFLGTFALPILLEKMGIGPTMLVMAAVTILGLILCIALAPETKGLTLAEAASIPTRVSGKVQSQEI